MKNVYEQVQYFFDLGAAADLSVKQEWVDGFLRQKAWQGTSDEKLQEIWQNIEMFLVYLTQSASNDLDEMSEQEYSLVIDWLSDHLAHFKANLKVVRRFFSVLNDFYLYLATKKHISNTVSLAQASQEIAGGRKLKRINVSLGTEMTLFGESAGRNLSETVEKLMLKFGAYFQQEDFAIDFDKALFLYTGPMEEVPGHDDTEFWLGFWDYFLFDYHLVQDDAVPIAHFAAKMGNRISEEEQKIIADLLRAKFSVFYINKILNQEWVECKSLFGDETFQLPYPDFPFNQIKKLLFFGHVFTEGIMMINYIISIEVSPNLRRRIRDEILRQHAIYRIQRPDATLREFLQRHVLVVRHIIDVLITQARVNVIPASRLERKFPAIVNRHLPNAEVIKKLHEMMMVYYFSRHDIELACQMWSDYCQLARPIVRKTEAWAMAVIHAFCIINMIDTVVSAEIAAEWNVSVKSVYHNQKKITDVLELGRFDPRYLNEEGFIFSIFIS